MRTTLTTHVPGLAGLNDMDGGQKINTSGASMEADRMGLAPFGRVASAVSTAPAQRNRVSIRQFVAPTGLGAGVAGCVRRGAGVAGGSVAAAADRVADGVDGTGGFAVHPAASIATMIPIGAPFIAWNVTLRMEYRDWRRVEFR